MHDDSQGPQVLRVDHVRKVAEEEGIPYEKCLRVVAKAVAYYPESYVLDEELQREAEGVLKDERAARGEQ